MEFWDPRSGICRSGTIQFYLSDSEELDLNQVMEFLAAAEVPGLVLEHLPPRVSARAAQTLTEATGVVIWQKSDRTSWLELLDETRRVIDARQSGTDLPGDGVSLGDLPRLADALADFLGGAVIIEDERLDVLGYSIDAVGYDPGRDAAILGRRMPAEWVEHLQVTGVLDELRVTDDAIELKDGPFTERRRMLAAIRIDRQVRGVIWLAEADTPLRPDSAQQLREAARAAAPHLRRHLELGRREKVADANRVKALLSGDVLPRGELEELGLAESAHIALIAVRGSDPARPLAEHDREHLQNAIFLCCQAARVDCAVTSIGGVVYCIVSTTEGRFHSGPMVVAETILRSCPRTVGTELHLTVTDSTSGLGDLALLRSQADRVLDALSRHVAGRSKIMTTKSAAPTLLLDSFADRARELQHVIRFDKIDRVRIHDRDHGTDYAKTLAIYLAANGNVSQAAAKLNVHTTSLRYRLRRLTELFSIDLEDSEERLLCAVLLRGRTD